MGYRTYIACISKRDYNKIKSLTYDEIIKHFVPNSTDPEEEHVGPYDIGKSLYEFGKYTDFQPPKGSTLPFFKKKDVKKRYGDYDLKTVTPEFLKYVIGTYEDRVKKNYNNMNLISFTNTEFIKSRKINWKTEWVEYDFSLINSDEAKIISNMIEHINSFKFEWLNDSPINLGVSEPITYSWKYEYSIFELVNIYNNFDWKKNIMFYYGY